MEIATRNVDGATVIALSGSLDGKTAPAAQAAVEAALQAGSGLVLDLAEVVYMSSAGLRVLLLLHRKAGPAGVKLALAAIPPELADTMSITGFLQYFTICATVDDGARAVK